MWPEKIISIVLVCEIGDRAAHVYIQEEDKPLENALK